MRLARARWKKIHSPDLLTLLLLATQSELLLLVPLTVVLSTRYSASMADNHPGHDHEAPTHTWRPPTRKAFLTTLSAAAFVSGLGIATVMSIRRGRRIRLEEAKELAKSTNTVARMGGSSSAKESTSDENALSASRGALSLFTEMNRAVFARRFRQESTDEVAQVPMILQRKEPKRSLFDTESQRPPPSALLKAGNTAQVAEQSSSRVYSAPHPGHRLSTPHNRAEGSLSVDEKTSSEEEYSFFDSPIFVALRALVTATFFVGIGAWVGIEIVYRWLQVKNVSTQRARTAAILNQLILSRLMSSWNGFPASSLPTKGESGL